VTYYIFSDTRRELLFEKQKSAESQKLD